MDHHVDHLRRHRRLHLRAVPDGLLPRAVLPRPQWVCSIRQHDGHAKYTHMHAVDDD